MKDIIYYNYNIDVDIICDNKEYVEFTYKGNTYFFVFFNRSIEELNDIENTCYELKNMGIKVHDIIINKDNKLITKVNDNYYVLLKLNTNKDNIVSFNSILKLNDKLKLNNRYSKLYRNNWPELWSKKVDYFEYQIKEIGKNKSIILDTFSYYIGLAENAISYANKGKYILNNNEYNITLSHRRIFYPNIALNYYNPLSFIFDLDVRDIAEYLKSEFFNGEDAFLDLKNYLKVNRLSLYSYHMLYARLLYPSYYFDIYENIMNKDSKEDGIFKIIMKRKEYEIFLQNVYKEINKYASIEEILWLKKRNN